MGEVVPLQPQRTSFVLQDFRRLRKIVSRLPGLALTGRPDSLGSLRFVLLSAGAVTFPLHFHGVEVLQLLPAFLRQFRTLLFQVAYARFYKIGLFI
jgi:hypothetical protein